MKDIWQGFAERFSGPVYAYITASVVLFNWKWLALLFMSKYPVEVRIAVISQYFDWFWNLVFPVVSGCLAAVFTPYLNLLVAFTHRWAKKFALSLNSSAENDKAEAAVKVARAVAKSNSAQALADARNEARKQFLEYRALKIATNVTTLRAEVEQLKSEHSENLNKFNMLANEIRSALQLNDALNARAEEINMLLPKDEHLDALLEARRKLNEVNASPGIRWRTKSGSSSLPKE